MFAKRLQLLRQEKKWTQAELAAKLGISKSTVGMYELGNRAPDNDLLVAIAKLFGVTTDYLLGRTNERGNVYLPDVIWTLEEAVKDIRFVNYASSYLAMIQMAARELSEDRAMSTKISFENFSSLDESQKVRMLAKAFDSVAYGPGGTFRLIPKKLSTAESESLLEKLKSLPQEEQQAIIRQLYG